MDKQMSREEFCEICKSEGLEVVCDDTGYGPNSIHATAYKLDPDDPRDRKLIEHYGNQVIRYIHP